MKNTNFKLFIGLIFSSLLIISCQTDPWDSVEEHLFHERNILEVNLGINTQGTPTITRDETNAIVEIFFLAPADFDLAAVPVDYIAISYGATTSATPGSTLNFDNAELKSTITVTSETGESLDWDIYLKEIPVNFSEMQDEAANGGEYWWLWYTGSLVWKDTWNIEGYWIDDPNENIEGNRDGTNVRPAWADASLDNTLTMTADGKFTIDAGADGELGDPTIGNYNVLNFASGRFYYNTETKIVNFIDDATGAKQEWLIESAFAYPTVVFNFVQETDQGVGARTVINVR